MVVAEDRESAPPTQVAAEVDTLAVDVQLAPPTPAAGVVAATPAAAGMHADLIQAAAVVAVATLAGDGILAEFSVDTWEAPVGVGPVIPDHPTLAAVAEVAAAMVVGQGNHLSPVVEAAVIRAGPGSSLRSVAASGRAVESMLQPNHR